MANKTPTPTNEQVMSSIPSEAEVRESFQRTTYVRPTSDHSGGVLPHINNDGPIYPCWANYKATLRDPSPVRVATPDEISTYNTLIRDNGEDAARQHLTWEWS